MAINKDFSNIDFDKLNANVHEAMKQIAQDISDDLFIGSASEEALDRMANEVGMTRICAHEWVEYQGLRECYSYCKHCDQKAISDRK